MKITMLTWKTIERFEAEYRTDQYTEEQIKSIELAAYIANMNKNGHPEWTKDDIFKDFIRVLRIDKIKVQSKEA